MSSDPHRSRLVDRASGGRPDPRTAPRLPVRSPVQTPAQSFSALPNPPCGSVCAQSLPNRDAPRPTKNPAFAGFFESGRPDEIPVFIGVFGRLIPLAYRLPSGPETDVRENRDPFDSRARGRVLPQFRGAWSLSHETERLRRMCSPSRQDVPGSASRTELRLDDMHRALESMTLVVIPDLVVLHTASDDAGGNADVLRECRHVRVGS